MKRLLFAALLAGSCPAVAQDVDIAVLGGKVIDGTGSEARLVDVLIKAGRIVEVGRADRKRLKAKQVIDAKGLIVAPGFIDSHAHGNPLVDKNFDNFLLQGVTTVVLGQDGVSPQDERVDYTDKLNFDDWSAANKGRPTTFPGPVTLAQWMKAVSAKGVSTNVAPLSGFGTNRALAGARTETPITPDQQSRSSAILEADLAAGAFGISSGLEYVPDRYSNKAELMTAAKITGRHGGLVMSHMRSEDSDKIAASVEELADQGRHARVHISHLKVVFARKGAEGDAFLSLLRDMRAKGVRISADVYPYYAGYADMTLVYPAWAKRRDQWDTAIREKRTILEAELEANVQRRNGPEAILIASGPYAGKTLKDIATEKGVSFTSVLIDIFGYGGPAAAHRVMLPEVQDKLVAARDIAISTDGGPWINHPRSWGSFPEVLERFVRERQLLSLESAIHKMTGLPASIVGLSDRGEIAKGKVADLVVFDFVRIHNNASWIKADAPPTGFEAIILNGNLVVASGERLPGDAGLVLKRQGSGR